MKANAGGARLRLASAAVACFALAACAAEPTEQTSAPASTPTKSTHESTRSDPSTSSSSDAGAAEEALPRIAEPRGRVYSHSDPRGDVKQRISPVPDGPYKTAPHQTIGNIIDLRVSVTAAES